jgi:hypothetical protein
MSPRKLARSFAILLVALGVSWIAYQSSARSQTTPGTKADRVGTSDPGDTRSAPRRPWDSARDLPVPITSDKTVNYDYPIVYVRVPHNLLMI